MLLGWNWNCHIRTGFKYIYIDNLIFNFEKSFFFKTWFRKIKLYSLRTSEVNFWVLKTLVIIAVLKIVSIFFLKFVSLYNNY